MWLDAIGNFGGLVKRKIESVSLWWQARVRKLTEHKRLESALAMREQAYRSLAENLPDNIARWDAAGRYVYVNAVQERVLATSAADLIGKTIAEAFPDGRFAPGEAAVAQVIATGKAELLVRQAVPVNGETRFHDVNLVPERDASGQLVSVLGIGRDMTDLYRLQDDLVTRERELRALADSAPGMMGSFYARPDGSTCMPYVSPNIEKLFGLQPQDVAHGISALTALHHPEDAQRVDESIAESARSMSTWHEEFRVLHPTLGERWMESNTNPEPHPQGGIIWYGHVHDITERKRMEAQLAQREREFRSLAESSPDSIVRYDRDGRHLYFNDRLLSHLGLASADEAIGKRPGEVWPDGRFAELELAVQRAMTGEVRVNIEIVEPNGRGGFWNHQIFVVPERGAMGRIVGAIAFGREISALREAERKLAHFIDNLPGMAYTFRLSPEGHGSFPYVSSAIEDIYGLKPEDVREDMAALHTLWHPDDQPRLEAAVAESIRTMRPLQIESHLCRPGQPERWFDVRSVPEHQPDGSILWYGIMLDITERKQNQHRVELLVTRDIIERRRHEQSLRDSRDFLVQIMDGTSDPIFVKDREHRLVMMNEAFCNLASQPREALMGKSAGDILPKERSEAIWETEELVFTSGETIISEESMANALGVSRDFQIKKTSFVSKDGQALLIGVMRDITELNAHRKRMHQMAFYDELTALPNRALFNDRLRQMVTDAAWHGQQAGVMLLDLDRFKNVNDTLGHPAGDQLLCEVARRLTGCVRAYDSVARLGGDEFAILLPGIRTAEELGRIASKILDAFKEPFVLEGKEVFSSTSVGIAVFPDDSSLADDLTRLADAAMYFAKRSGRNNFRFYAKELSDSSSEKLALESELRHALERQELELYYQPKISLTDGRVVGSEALLRWNNPKRGRVPPDQFISMAEDSGLIVDIGAWVLLDACRTASAWNGPDRPLHKVAINLSARQFQTGDLLKTVRQAMAQTTCQPEWIELEITESLLLDEDGEVQASLNAFRAMGIAIAIDDFGTGYSALSYLARFPINTLKIDRSFIGSIMVEHYRAELVKAIISIAHCLGQEVVAEGVETWEQAAFLQAHGCQMAQGYLYCKPVARTAFESLPRSYPIVQMSH